MPIYEYKCQDCDSKFEILIYSDNDMVKCENCGSEKCRKLFSGFASAGSSSKSTSCGSSGGFT